jgi:hypothetical protein
MKEYGLAGENVVIKAEALLQQEDGTESKNELP